MRSRPLLLSPIIALALVAFVMSTAVSTTGATPGEPGRSATSGSSADDINNELTSGDRLALRVELPGDVEAVARDHDLRVVDVVGPESDVVLVVARSSISRNELRDDPRVSWLTGPETLGATSTAHGVFWAWGLFWAWSGDQQDADTALASSTWASGINADAGAGVVIAVIDSGIDRRHWSFAGVHLAQGYDFVDGDTNPDDSANGIDDDGDGRIDEGAGHGTYVASLIAQGAPGATILPIRAIDDEGMTDTWRVARAIEYAVDQGADIVNLSLGGTSRDRLIKRLIGDYTDDRGILFVAAAGNTGSALETYPAAEDEPIAVGATTDGHATPFSAHGPWVDLWAPGTGLVGAIPGGDLVTWDGTSAAAAVVTAEAARAAATTPDPTAAAIRAALGVPLPRRLTAPPPVVATPRRDLGGPRPTSIREVQIEAQVRIAGPQIVDLNCDHVRAHHQRRRRQASDLLKPFVCTGDPRERLGLRTDWSAWHVHPVQLHAVHVDHGAIVGGQAQGQRRHVGDVIEDECVREVVGGLTCHEHGDLVTITEAELSRSDGTTLDAERPIGRLTACRVGERPLGTGCHELEERSGVVDDRVRRCELEVEAQVGVLTPDVVNLDGNDVGPLHERPRRHDVALELLQCAATPVCGSGVRADGPIGHVVAEDVHTVDVHHCAVVGCEVELE